MNITIRRNTARVNIWHAGRDRYADGSSAIRLWVGRLYIAIGREARP